MSASQDRRHLRVHARRTLPGAAPGTLESDPGAPKPRIRVTRFDEKELVEEELTDVTVLAQWRTPGATLWVDCAGLGDASIIKRLGEELGLHALSLEDVLNVHQRPKLEDYEDYLYVVIRQSPGKDFPVTEQVSLFLGKDFVATFQEDEFDWFQPVRERLRRSPSRVRRSGSDFLAYSLLDAVVDHYFPLLEQTGERLEQLEEEVVNAPSPGIPARLLAVRHELLALRRAIWPLREVISALQREDSEIVSQETRVYLRDCYDHVVQLIDVLESLREVPGSLMDVYLSSVSNRMNEVMKVLTVIATVFIPLTFVSSIYGMNFDPKSSPFNMPELTWYWGYPFALLLMALIAVGLLVYFRRQGWLGESRAVRRLRERGKRPRTLQRRQRTP
ncbi:MAG: magnesium/cobalt transporter CorA [Polyangiaceae bacterium]